MRRNGFEEYNSLFTPSELASDEVRKLIGDSLADYSPDDGSTGRIALLRQP